MSKYRIAVIDDEIANTESLDRILRADGAEVILYQRPSEALAHLGGQRVDVVLTDMRMDGMSGIELLEAVKVLDPAIEVVLMTAYGTVELAVSAMRKGASDFITKPLQRVQVLKSVHLALERRGLMNENRLLRQELQSLGMGRGTMVGKSPSILGTLEVALQAARSRANVLIEGESGTGKGVLAEYIHRRSEAAGGVLVKINCAAIPDNLLEAELFGYEPGAFTGAVKQKKGRVELSHNGTLFLDEIGIAPITLQAKLLRFVQDGEFERLGGMDTQIVKTRIVAATNADLKRAIEQKVFREDLYYRLNVVHLRVPPLRERIEDVGLLAHHFIEVSAKKNARPVPWLLPEALLALEHYAWPGNIRELQNIIERAVVLCRGESIGVDLLPQELVQARRSRVISVPVGTTLRDAEKQLIDETLKHARGDKRLAARILGIHPRTIYRHLDETSQGSEPML
ncbi:MAG: sigma-54-dependent Fis family transcriptional regulator [Deltaproteobacteria bacterium]|nr:sigma-54-dependent Fis family transcriptional regulator [Deltaproteobacteria bacterium]